MPILVQVGGEWWWRAPARDSEQWKSLLRETINKTKVGHNTINSENLRLQAAAAQQHSSVGVRARSCAT